MIRLLQIFNSIMSSESVRISFHVIYYHYYLKLDLDCDLLVKFIMVTNKITVQVQLVIELNLQQMMTSQYEMLVIHTPSIGIILSTSYSISLLNNVCMKLISLGILQPKFPLIFIFFKRYCFKIFRIYKEFIYDVLFQA